MKQKWFVLYAALIFMLLPQLSIATTSQSDKLIDKLILKGILTKEEAAELKAEVTADDKVASVDEIKSVLPEWIQKMKLKGDFRLRYQYERKQADTDARERGRIRYRLGIETDIVKDVKVGAGLASGGADPRSSNQSFADTFSSKNSLVKKMSRRISENFIAVPLAEIRTVYYYDEANIQSLGDQFQSLFFNLEEMVLK